jgi:hypothetical protein
MTFEQQDIQNGISAMKDALQTCQKYDWVIYIRAKTTPAFPPECQVNAGRWSKGLVWG